MMMLHYRRLVIFILSHLIFQMLIDSLLLLLTGLCLRTFRRLYPKLIFVVLLVDIATCVAELLV